MPDLQTQKGIAEYMRSVVLAVPPRQVTPLDPAKVFAVPEAYYADPEYTTAHPHLRVQGDQVMCQFCEECPGDARCTGVLLHRSGLNGQQGAETLCEQHQDRWWERHAAEIAAIEEAQQARIERTRQVLLDAAQIPPFFADFTLANFPGDRHARRHCQDWAQQEAPGYGLVLIGNFGVGKTALAASIVHERVLRWEEHALFMTAGELLARLRPGPEHDDRLMGRLRSADLLVVDDIGAEQSTEWTREQWFNLLQYRHNHLKPLILTTNHPSSELSSSPVPPDVETLEDRIGARAAQRLLDRAAFQVVLVRGANLRKRAQAQS